MLCSKRPAGDLRAEQKGRTQRREVLVLATICVALTVWLISHDGLDDFLLRIIGLPR